MHKTGCCKETRLILHVPSSSSAGVRFNDEPVFSAMWWLVQAFKDGDIRFLICTDVAARGIDIAGLPYVINMTLPDRSEDYIHRVGRVGELPCLHTHAHTSQLTMCCDGSTGFLSHQRCLIACMTD